MSRRELSQKIISRGAASLTDAELLSFTASGDDDFPIEKATQILVDSSLAELSLAEPAKLRQKGGLGISRAVRLAAAFELGRRVRNENSQKVETITSSADVVQMFQPMLSHLAHEEFWVLYLNSAHKIIDKVRVGQGGVNNLTVDHKLIIKRALELLSTAIVVVHNHPSGESQASDEDIALTAKLVTAASLFDIELLDHIIVTANTCNSLRAQGIITSAQD